VSAPTTGSSATAAGVQHAISFAPVARRHMPLLSAWLDEPHVRRWWPDKAQTLADIADDIGARSPEEFIILADATPIGFIRRWQLGAFNCEPWLSDAPWIAEFPGETVGIDLFIGAKDAVGRGLGPQVLSTFVAKLRAEGNGHAAIIIDPEAANTPAVRAYHKAGFRDIPDLQGRTGRIRLMKFDPQAAAANPPRPSSEQTA